MSDTPWGTWLGGAWKVAFGSATQGLWLADRKVGSQVVGEKQWRKREGSRIGR